MENRLTRLIYDRSPAFLRNAYASFYGWRKQRKRFGKDYDKWLRFFEDAHKWSASELIEYQNKKLRELVQRAYSHVRYYRELFDRVSITPGDIRDIDDLPKLPVLEKATVIRECDNLVADDACRSSLEWHRTSGTTGTPLSIPWSAENQQCEYGFIWARCRQGVTRKDPQSSFSGVEIVPPGRTSPPFWADNWANHQRMFSIFHLSDENLWYYYRALEKRYSRYYVGFGSAVYTIAEFMRSNGLKLSRPPQCFFNASEKLLPHYANTISEVFGCEIWDHYGQGERVASITKYPCGHLHYDMDYAVIEFLPLEHRDDGSILAEVVGTNMHDSFWPLLRYRTGDMVLYHPEDTCPDGLPGRVIREIYGRTTTYFTLPDGRRIYNVTVIARACRNIRFLQVVQEQEGEIVIRVVPEEHFQKADEQHMLQLFRRRLGEEVGIHVQYVDKIASSKKGKYSLIINRLQKKSGNPTPERNATSRE